MVKTFPFLVDNDLYYHDAAAAQRVIDYVETFCKLATPYGKPFVLLPWERQIVWDVFGWYCRDSDERRFNFAYIEVPRKNGKTYFVAALALYMLMADGTNGAEVYAAACSRAQSGILFKSVRRMIDQCDELRTRLVQRPSKSEIEYPKGDSILRALSRESVDSHGKYPSAVIMDELHSWQGSKANDLYEALITGFGNRRSPLVIQITTAGFGGQPSICKREHDKAIRFAEGRCDDSTFYGVVYGLTQEDDWTLESNWRKANPSWDLAAKTLRREFPKAKEEPTAEISFRRLYLNQWTAQRTSRWLQSETWNAARRPLRYEDYQGQDVYLGLDMGSTYDLTALALLYPQPDGSWVLFVRHYMPRKSVEKYSRQDAIPYDQWAEQGWLTITDGVSNGQTVDYPTLIEDIREVARENKVLQLGYDPSGAAYVIPELEAVGIDCMSINQRHKDLDAGTKEFARRLVSGELTVAANPLLDWQADNVEVEQRDTMIKPAKPNSKGSYGGTAKLKVDGITASVIAAQLAVMLGNMAAAEEPPVATVMFVKR
jgi:phage terminase large subunit-like protein